MTITLYELCGRGDRRFSPYCWRTRFALAHKGLDYETEPVPFADKQAIAFSGQGRVPVLRDGETVVADSWAIACYLEDAYPDAPSLFGGAAGRAMTRFFNHWADTALNLAMIRLVVRDVLDHVADSDREYFRRTREERFGATLEALHEARDERLPAVRAAFEPARATLADRPFFAGAAPAYADYVLLGTLQWLRMVGPYRVLEAADPILDWRARMFDRLGAGVRDVPAHDP